MQRRRRSDPLARQFPNQGEPGAHGPLGIVLMGRRVAEHRDHPVAEGLQEQAFQAFDDAADRGVVAEIELIQVFGVEIARDPGGIHQIGEKIVKYRRSCSEKAGASASVGSGLVIIVRQPPLCDDPW